MSFAAFVYVTFEMFAVGLITPMAADLGVTEGRIGLLMTVYAAIVAAVTIPLMHLTRRWDRKPLFTGTLVFLLAGVVLQALAVNYAMLVVARVAAALTHGLFWSLVNPMAARLAAPGQTGKAVAAVSMGSTMALVFGSPAATFIGGMIGWRSATWVLGVFVVASFAVLVATLPPMSAVVPGTAARGEGERSAIPSLVVFLTLAVTALFTTYTYLGLIVENTSGPVWVAAGLSLYGIVGIVGVLWAGRRVDKRMIRLNVAPTAVMVVSAGIGLAALALEGTVAMALTALFIIVFGIGAGALPTVATTIFLFAGGANQDRASAIYVVTFQVGIAAGSALGAAAVDGGVLAGTLVSTAVLAAAAGAVLALWSRPILR
ncbi:MFS transporter [Corynebacterium qintianiae]|uniref:MFS transporter n=1 Tax=Corynebacterium qintianiae TaxID=2709392 RepID=UPI0013EB0D8C|nr:MFS transporter [Corynebacterium qintianiae]